MVSQRTVIVLITLAILLSAISIAVTVSTLNTSSIPEKPNTPKINYQYEKPVPDVDKAQVSISNIPVK